LPKNGETNKRFGLYRSLCCSYEILVAEHATFPDCPNHLNLPTIWKSIADDPIPHVREILAQERIRSGSEPPHVFLDHALRFFPDGDSLEQWENAHLLGCGERQDAMMQAASDFLNQQKGQHLSLQELWDHANDLTGLTPDQLHHLGSCEDCVGILWQCRLGKSFADVAAILKRERVPGA
jgi:hypothetical protein